MTSRSSINQICSKIVKSTTHTRTFQPTTASTVLKRHASTFGFFSRNIAETIPPSPPTQPLTSSSTSALSSQLDGTLKLSPSYANAAPMLEAIRNKDQDTAWMVYSVLCRAGLENALLPIHYSALLKSIRINTRRFTKSQVQTLTERFETVWSRMTTAEGGSNVGPPDMVDHTTRLQFFLLTRQFQKFDQAWAELSEAMAATPNPSTATATGDVPSARPVATGRAPLTLTLFTYNLRLSSCVYRKDIGRAMSTLTLMRRAGIKPDNISWDYILQIHTAMKNWNAVETTYRHAFISTDSMQGVEWSQPRMVVPLGQRVNGLHGGLLDIRAPPTAQSPQEQHVQKLKPTLKNTHTLFSCYAHTRDLDELRVMFDSHVRLFGLVPTTRTYNEMIKFAFLARRDTDALNLFRELVEIGQKVDRVQELKEQEAMAETSAGGNSGDVQTAADAVVSDQEPFGAQAQAQAPYRHQVCGPDFNTFKVMVDNELIASRNRWGRAWRWIRVMQETYGLEPSNGMFKRTLASMKRRGGSEEDIAALQQNWDQVRARRE